jgi:hypothetical protein
MYYLIHKYSPLENKSPKMDLNIIQWILVIILVKNYLQTELIERYSISSAEKEIQDQSRFVETLQV